MMIIIVLMIMIMIITTVTIITVINSDIPINFILLPSDILIIQSLCNNDNDSSIILSIYH